MIIVGNMPISMWYTGPEFLGSNDQARLVIGYQLLRDVYKWEIDESVRRLQVMQLL